MSNQHLYISCLCSCFIPCSDSWTPLSGLFGELYIFSLPHPFFFQFSSSLAERYACRTCESMIILIFCVHLCSDFRIVSDLLIRPLELSFFEGLRVFFLAIYVHRLTMRIESVSYDLNISGKASSCVRR